MTPEFATIHERDAVAHRHGLSLKEMADVYTDWAPAYEKDLTTEGIYNGPDYVANKLKEIYCDNPENVRVLDVASGTGLLGEKLIAQGFRNIHGLDASQGMLNISKEKNVYRELICAYMSDNTACIQTDSYDCIAISGGMGESHIPVSALSEMIRIVKPGGYVCIVMREEYLETAEEYNNNKLDNYMNKLEKMGQWQKIERTIKPNYSFNKNGVLYLYKVLV